MATQVTLKILRYDPEKDKKAHFETYTVEADPLDRILDVLNTVKWYVDGSLTYRRSCAHGVCGSDAMRINGRNRLACKVLVADVGGDTGKKIQIEPMLGFKIMRDLVVDMDPFFDKYKSIKPYLISYEDAPPAANASRAPKTARFSMRLPSVFFAGLVAVPARLTGLARTLWVRPLS